MASDKVFKEDLGNAIIHLALVGVVGVMVTNALSPSTYQPKSTCTKSLTSFWCFYC